MHYFLHSTSVHSFYIDVVLIDNFYFYLILKALLKVIEGQRHLQENILAFHSAICWIMANVEEYSQSNICIYIYSWTELKMFALIYSGLNNERLVRGRRINGLSPPIKVANNRQVPQWLRLSKHNRQWWKLWQEQPARKINSFHGQTGVCKLLK